MKLHSFCIEWTRWKCNLRDGRLQRPSRRDIDGRGHICRCPAAPRCISNALICTKFSSARPQAVLQDDGSVVGDSIGLLPLLGTGVAFSDLTQVRSFLVMPRCQRSEDDNTHRRRERGYHIIDSSEEVVEEEVECVIRASKDVRNDTYRLRLVRYHKMVVLKGRDAGTTKQKCMREYYFYNKCTSSVQPVPDAMVVVIGKRKTKAPIANDGTDGGHHCCVPARDV